MEINKDTIVAIKGREILDSRGFPTVEAELFLEGGAHGVASVPSGASVGTHEACELRDQDAHRYGGRGVRKAVDNINGVIENFFKGRLTTSQEAFDKALIELDASSNKSHLGANAILAVSFAYARAQAQAHREPLFLYLNKNLRVSEPLSLPTPLINILNGGVHAHNGLAIQEFMIVPGGASSFSHALEMAHAIFYSLKRLLVKRGFSTSVGDEGGFSPTLKDARKALDFLMEAIENTPYRIGRDVLLALDAASSEFYNKTTDMYLFEGQERTAQDMVEFWETLVNNYPITSIEDGLSEDDEVGWQFMSERLGKKLQLVGDDIFVTQEERLRHGVENKLGNAILIKPNQVGTIFETFETMRVARENNYATVVSHRSGETSDAFIADLAVATGAGQIKTGSLCRSERLSKYNQLLRIEGALGHQALYAGWSAIILPQRL